LNTWKAKAVGPLSTIALLKAEIGDERFDNMVASMPAPTRKILERQVLPLEWLSYEDLVPLNEWMLASYDGNETRYIEFMERVAHRDFSTVYKMILRVMSPVFVLKQASRIMATYNTRGTLTVSDQATKDGAHHFLLTMTEVYPHHLVLLNIHGYMNGLLLMTGAKNVRLVAKDIIIDSKGLHGSLVGSYAARAT
jgi:hypothetical protein